VSTDGIAVLVANFARIQFDLPVTPGTDPCDGVFEVAVVRSKNVVGLLPAVAAAVLDRSGEHPDRSPSIDVYTARSVEVSAYPPLRMQSDGEVLDALTPFAARVLPKAALMLVPSDSPYALQPPAIA
jgi:diacylglycerol kinase family enzyme